MMYIDLAYEITACRYDDPDRLFYLLFTLSGAGTFVAVGDRRSSGLFDQCFRAYNRHVAHRRSLIA